jgi:phosphoenolpyruvate carboxykinase (ATP)
MKLVNHFIDTADRSSKFYANSLNEHHKNLVESDYGLGSSGLRNLGHVYRNLSVPALVEHALQRGEGLLANNGALCVETGAYTGRSPKDRFIVDEPVTHNEIDWNQHNVPLTEEKFERLYQRVLAYVQGRDLYVFDGFVGADPNYRFGVRVINELASQNLFAHQLFIRPTVTELETHHADFTVIAVPGLECDPQLDGVNSEAFIVLHLSRGIVLIGGSRYAGEIKKSIFSMMNYAMTKRDVLPMHAAANVDRNGNTALFFGLSGTGKTSLSADGDRGLIGDDEHGWSADGIFNFEGGCYAKTIHLSQDHEPQIWSAIRFGALLENVALAPHSRQLDYDSSHRTENTRAAYPLHHIPNSVPSGMGGHPTALLFLTADAFGVLPPIAILTREQAMYYFLLGYTSKLAGTERGITTPQATFSACFGQCFFPLSPTVYAKMLGDRLLQHPDTQVYLVNTGWSGGAYGVGQRIPIEYTRAMVAAALSGELHHTECTPHPIFNLLVPNHVPGVPDRLLDPRSTWANSAAYDQQAQQLAQRFAENFRQFASADRTLDPAVMAAGQMAG